MSLQTSQALQAQSSVRSAPVAKPRTVHKAQAFLGPSEQDKPVQAQLSGLNRLHVPLVQPNATETEMPPKLFLESQRFLFPGQKSKALLRPVPWVSNSWSIYQFLRWASLLKASINNPGPHLCHHQVSFTMQLVLSMTWKSDHLLVGPTWTHQKSPRNHKRL